MTRALSFLCALLLSSSVATGALKRPKNDDEAVRMLTTNFVAAWNKHDAKAMAAYFTDDATFVGVDGHRAQGRAEIEKHFRDMHGASAKPAKLESGELKLQWIRKDLVFFDWTMIVTSAGEGEPTTSRRQANGVFTKNKGHWWVAAVRVNATTAQ